MVKANKNKEKITDEKSIRYFERFYGVIIKNYDGTLMTCYPKSYNPSTLVPVYNLHTF